MQYHIFVYTPIRKAVSFYPGQPMFLVSGQMFWVSALVTAYCICCAIWFWPDVLPFTFARLVLLSVHSTVATYVSVSVSVSWSGYNLVRRAVSALSLFWCIALHYYRSGLFLFWCIALQT